MEIEIGQNLGTLISTAIVLAWLAFIIKVA